MGTWRAVTAAIAICLAATFLPAQPPTSRPAADGWIDLDIGGGPYKSFAAVCDLDAKQQERILTLLSAHQALLDKLHEATRPIIDKLLKARAADDKNLESQAQQELAAVSKERAPDIQKSQARMNADVLGVITLQQKARWRTYCVATQIKKEYAPAGLTDGQWDKVIDACEPLAKDLDVPAIRIRTEIRVKLVDILSLEQKIKFWLSKQPYAEMVKICNLTDEQIRKIVKIEDEHCRQLPGFMDSGEKEIAQVEQAVDRARQAGDEAAAAKLQRQWVVKWDVLHTYPLPVPNYSQEQVEAVLTEKQKAAWCEHVKNMPGIDEYKAMIGGGR